MIIRRINGLRGEYQSLYPPAQNDTYVKATSIESTAYQACFATAPSKSLTDSDIGNSWESNNQTTNQRFHIDLGSAKVISRIYYENMHSSGSETDKGLKNFTFWGSNVAAAFAKLTYGTDTNWTQITTNVTQMAQHVAANQADPQYIYIFPLGAYRYYAFKIAYNWGDASYMGVRRIELQEML